MKHSQTIGIVSSLILIGLCFLPWSYIVSQQLTISGLHAPNTNYGKPGMLHIILSLIMVIFFSIPAIWAKRTNVLIGALNLAWAFRNFLLISACMMGECPEKKWSLYALPVFAGLSMLMCLLPKIPVKTVQEV